MVAPLTLAVSGLGDEMRVVAARFPGPREARAVLDLICRRFHVDPPDVAVAPLGTPGQPPADDMVLAGRFADDFADTVVALVREGGGEIVADVDETWTRPRHPEGGERPGGSPSRWERRARRSAQPFRMTI